MKTLQTMLLLGLVASSSQDAAAIKKKLTKKQKLLRSQLSPICALNAVAVRIANLAAAKMQKSASVA